MPTTVSADIDSFLNAANDAAARAALGAAGTALEITTALQGAAAIPTSIGAEYMPASLPVDYVNLADGATALLNAGDLGRQGNRMYMGDGVQDGGLRIGAKPLFISRVVKLDSDTIPQTGTGINDTAFLEMGRIELDPQDLEVGKIMSVMGKVKFSATVAPGARRRFTFVPAALWDAYTADPTNNYAASAAAIESILSTSTGAFGFIPGDGTTDNAVTEMDMDIAISALMTLQLNDYAYWANITKTIYGRGYNWLPTPGATVQVAPVGGGGSSNFDITLPSEMVLIFSLATNITTAIDLDVNLFFSIQ